MSERAARSVQERADLLEGSDISPLLLQLVSHVSAYKVILRRWDQGEKAESSVVHYPEELEQWVSEGFLLLKQRAHEHERRRLFDEREDTQRARVRTGGDVVERRDGY